MASWYLPLAARGSVCISLKRDHGVEFKPENVLITPDEIAAIHTIGAAFLNVGDEVLIADQEYSACCDSVGGNIPQ